MVSYNKTLLKRKVSPTLAFSRVREQHELKMRGVEIWLNNQLQKIMDGFGWRILHLITNDKLEKFRIRMCDGSSYVSNIKRHFNLKKRLKHTKKNLT